MVYWLVIIVMIPVWSPTFYATKAECETARAVVVAQSSMRTAVICVPAPSR